MNDTYVYGQYRVEYVYRRTTPEQRRWIVDFWRRNGAIPDPLEAERRAHEVVLMATKSDSQSAADDVIGITTVYRERRELGEGNKRPCFIYRMFIQPGDRDTLLVVFMFDTTYKCLRRIKAADKPDYLVVVTENPKLMREGVRRTIESLGFTYHGRNERGQDIWVGDLAE